MPTDGSGEFSPEALEHKIAYWRGRRAALAGRDLAAAARAEDREHRLRALLDRRQRAHDQAALLREMRADAEEQRQNARAALEALRANPLYDLHRRWRRRIDNGTLYDAKIWRSTGRLVPVTQRNLYTAGGGSRREVVDWTDVLDREAQELGVHSNDLPRLFERLDKQIAHAHQLADEAERERRSVDEFARELRAA